MTTATQHKIGGVNEIGIGGRRVEPALTVEQRQAIQLASLRQQARERYREVGRVRAVGSAGQWLACEDGTVWQAVRVFGRGQGRRRHLVAPDACRIAVDGTERPKTKRRWRTLEPVEVRQVARAFSDEQAWMIFLMLI